MQAYKCDMCGEYFDGEPEMVMERGDGIGLTYQGNEPRHLCPECWRKVKAYIEGGGN